MTMGLNYMRALVCSFAGSAVVPVIDTDGVSRSINFGGTFPVNALAGQDHFGLQVGASGDASVGDEWSLGSQITEGSGVGMLHHGVVDVISTEVVEGVIEFTVTRSFINTTEAPITIREVGLVARHSGYNILLSRDVIEPIEIPSMDGVNVMFTHRTAL